MATIIRIAREHKRFSTVEHFPLEDERLPWSARGLLYYLLAQSNDREIQVEDLKQRGDLGRDALYRLFGVLQRYGYLQREQGRDARGRLTKTVYTAFDVPERPFAE